MSIWSFRCCAESNSFVTFGEFNVEEGDKCLNVVITSYLEMERCSEI